MIREKIELWRNGGKGFKSRFHPKLHTSVIERSSIDQELTEEKIERGDSLQEARLKYYPSINVDLDKLFAGYVETDLSEAKDMIHQMGYRNNPTAYVEVTDELGADEGSFARQIITESGVGFNRVVFHNQPTLFRREKRQIHVCTFVVEEQSEIIDNDNRAVVFLAHEERSAWLQPMRHVTVNDAEGKKGVRRFREDWYEEFGEELGGEDKVIWETLH